MKKRRNWESTLQGIDNRKVSWETTHHDETTKEKLQPMKVQPASWLFLKKSLEDNKSFLRLPYFSSSHRDMKTYEERKTLSSFSWQDINCTFLMQSVCRELRNFNCTSLREGKIEWFLYELPSSLKMMMSCQQQRRRRRTSYLDAPSSSSVRHLRHFSLTYIIAHTFTSAMIVLKELHWSKCDWVSACSSWRILLLTSTFTSVSLWNHFPFITLWEEQHQHHITHPTTSSFFLWFFRSFLSLLDALNLLHL